MSDETVPQPEDTPAPDQAAPDGTPASDAQPDANWEKRYSDLQPEYTRVSQEAAQYRQFIQLARAGDPDALAELGLSFPDDEEDEYEDDDSDEPLYDPRVDQLLQAEQQRQEEALVDELEDHVLGEIDRLASANGLEDLPEAAVDLIVSYVTLDDAGNPAVEQAFQKVTGLLDDHVKSYVAGKRKAVSAPSGSSASHQPNLDDDNERREYIASRLAGI